MEFKMWKELPDFERMFNINSNSYIVTRSIGIVIYTDVSNQGYGVVLMPWQGGGIYIKTIEGAWEKPPCPWSQVGSYCFCTSNTYQGRI